MSQGTSSIAKPETRVLSAYLLGCLDFDDLLALQRRLVYEVAGDRSAGVLLICEHSPCITMGREASAAHIRLNDEELRDRRWPIRWVNRGGGCLLSVPGQVAVYPIFALDELGLNVQDYLDRLHEIARRVLVALQIPAEVRAPASGVWVGDRRIAHVGVSVRDWVSSFGFTLNVEPNLKLFPHVACDGDPKPMTSVERERRVRIRPAAVRQLLLNEFAEQFAFDRVSLFHHHPAFSAKAPVHAAVTHPG